MGIKVEVAYTHWGIGCGVFNEEFETETDFNLWLDKTFTEDESQYKLIGILKK